MKDADLIRALKRMGVQTGGLMCVGCGHEHNCGVHGCAVIREAAQRLEELLFGGKHQDRNDSSPLPEMQMAGTGIER